MQEVSRVHSTRPAEAGRGSPQNEAARRKPFARNSKLRAPLGKEQIHRKKLNPHYVAGFIDGEGSFSVSIGRHKTLKRGFEVRPEFEIELRADDQEVLERLLVTIGCGKIYDCSYERYGWFPHVKYKITSAKDMRDYLFPFLGRYPLQAKKAEIYKFFREIVLMVCSKRHLSDAGFKKIIKLRKEIRKRGKKAKTYGNR